MNRLNLRRFFGDKAFYKTVLLIALPVMIQNGFTNLVNMLDNLMVGQVGTDQMSGVAIVNQLIFVFNLSIFGGLSGAGIFTAQFFGKNDENGVRNVFRIKLLVAAAISVIGIFVLGIGRIPLIQNFLHDGSITGNLDFTLTCADEYLQLMLIGLIPFAITQSYTSTLRETGETVIPMKAGIVAVFVNFIFNYLLIFGKFGFPELGVRGAAIATLLSRFVEMGYVLFFTYRNPDKFPFAVGLFKNFCIPKTLLRSVAFKGMPLLMNEFLWSAGMTMLTQCYSTRGLAAVAGINICNTINNVFNIVFMALGSSIAIVVGQLLGAGEMEEARLADTRMIVFSELSCVGIAALMFLLAPLFPQFYNTTEEVRVIATSLIRIMACMMPFNAFTHASYFTLRSGGKTIITFIFDSGYIWALCVPVAFLLSRFTALPLIPLYLCCQSLDVLKCIIGFILVKKGSWLNNIVGGLSQPMENI